MTFITDLNRETESVQGQILSEVARSTLIASIVVSIAILLGIVATFLVLRSIAKPLDEVVAAMAGITAGNLNSPISASAPDEIGAMARTLRLFRDSIIERAELSAQSEAQRRMIQTAIETISDGFVVFDPDDRMVLCNRKFHEIYPRIDDVAKPGAEFIDILKVGVARGVIKIGNQTPDDWIAERMRLHVDSDRVHRVSPRHGMGAP